MFSINKSILILRMLKQKDCLTSYTVHTTSTRDFMMSHFLQFALERCKDNIKALEYNKQRHKSALLLSTGYSIYCDTNLFFNRNIEKYSTQLNNLCILVAAPFWHLICINFLKWCRFWCRLAQICITQRANLAS